ncbi:MAG: DUF2357 domain-containing protein [Desulfitobacterium hafniense]|nr:DUF2357 domain-containing protein [Desulfitobacterium hafniense]
MAFKITLSAIDVPDVELQLSPAYSAFTGTEMVDVVYQGLKYDYILSGFDLLRPITNIELFVNNKPIKTEFSIAQEDGNPIAHIHPQGLASSEPFNLVYGITEITVHLEYANHTEQYLFSSHLAIAIEQRYRSTMDSIREMLDDIYVKDHALFYKGKPRNSCEFPKYLRNQNSKYEEEIATLKTIIVALRKNLPYFSQSPRVMTVSEFRVDSFEKLHTVNSQNLCYIATHPEQLKQSYGTYGIFVNRHQMIPEKTLVSAQKFSRNTPENRIILSFVNTLLCYVNNRRIELKKALDGGISSVELNAAVRENYMLSTTIIQQYKQIAFKEYLLSLDEISTQFSILFAQYQRVLSCEFSLLRHAPEPTPVFLEIYHYRNIYEMINLWFGFGDFSIPAENILLHFSTADTIYEYYCLLCIYDILVSLGFKEVVEKREPYKYDIQSPFYVNTDKDNTFYFQNGNCEITLFYQPVIYSGFSQTTNNISLFRSDRSHYAPDFIIKKQTSSEISYGIFDAKWRNRSVLTNRESDGGLFDLVYNYLYSIADAQTLKSVSMFWLLQGKDDAEFVPTYFHNHGSISRTKSQQFRNATGIVRLTPKSGASELTQILRTFIFS